MDIKIIQLYYLSPNSNFFFSLLIKNITGSISFKGGSNTCEVSYEAKQSKTTKNHKQNN